MIEHSASMESITAGIARMTAVVAGAPDPEIVELEARLRAAQLSADVDALDALIADELLFAGPAGALMTKEEDLASQKSGAVRFLEHEPLELRVRRVGDEVAVTALRARLAVEIGGTVTHGQYRYLRVWAREHEGGWHVVGGQVALVPEQ